MICARLAFSASGMGAERDVHLEGHKAFLRSGRLDVVQSGPLFDDEQRQVGALVVADVSSIAAMRAISEEDPFVAHGIYDRVSFFEWRQTIGGVEARNAD